MGHRSGTVIISHKDGVSSEGVSSSCFFESTVRVWREFRCVYQKVAPDAKRIKAWHNKFLEGGSILKAHGGGWQHVYDEEEQNISTVFMWLKEVNLSGFTGTAEAMSSSKSHCGPMCTRCRYYRSWNLWTSHRDRILPFTWFTKSADTLTFWHVSFPTRQFSCLWCCEQVYNSDVGITVTTQHHGPCVRQPKKEHLVWHYVQHDHWTIFLCREDCHR
jgi:hypothetical protein